MMQARARGTVATAWALAGLALLTACTGQTPAPAASESSSAAPEASASASPTAAPEYDPAGTADGNRAYFDAVNQQFFAAGLMPGGRPIIDNLVAAGFDRASMQVTQDATSIGDAVDSVQFSVRIGTDCLLGQASDAGYVSTVGPALTGGACLAGATRVIDW